MDTYFQVVAAVLVAVVLSMVLGKYSGGISILLSIGVCCMIAIAAVQFLKPVLGFWEQLQKVGQISNSWLIILTKVVGISLISEIAVLICTDSGNASLGKAIQILSAAVVLWLSIPLLQELLSLIQKILGDT